MEISSRSKEIILGSLLGDASLIISKGYKNARFQFRHSIVQEEYFNWKANQLKEISSENSCHLQHPDGWSRVEKLHYQSFSLPCLTELYNLTHSDGEFVFRKEWLMMLTPLSLLVWWLDDGSLVKNSRQGVLCCEGFDLESITMLRGHLQEQWNIVTHIGRRGIYHHLRFYSTEELKKFLRLILPQFVVSSMLPKMLLLYRDLELQQRWISEVNELTGFSNDVIENYVAPKRQRWAEFSSENDIVRSSK
jgi:LAGLIDADG DNA endonuclease family